MKLSRLFFISVLTGTFFIACNKDDDNVEEIPPRDKGEQAIEDDETLKAYLDTHFYNYEDFQNPPSGFDYVVRFDTIAGENANKTPISASPLLSTKVVNRDDIDYNMYILKIREGVGRQPTFADSTFVTYQGSITNRTIFESNTVIPSWFDLPGYVALDQQGRLTRYGGSIVGFSEGLTEFREGSGFEVNPDNTIKWNNDFGVGALFFPSGLGYFNSAPMGSNIPAYSPLIFSINLLRAVEADHDNDGIPSWMEDLDGDENLFNDDTDKNGSPNHSDPDDDGDGTPTRKEIIINPDGTIEFPDTSGNGIPNYLDPDTFEEL